MSFCIFQSMHHFSTIFFFQDFCYHILRLVTIFYHHLSNIAMFMLLVSCTHNPPSSHTPQTLFQLTRRNFLFISIGPLHMKFLLSCQSSCIPTRVFWSRTYNTIELLLIPISVILFFPLTIISSLSNLPISYRCVQSILPNLLFLIFLTLLLDLGNLLGSLQPFIL